MIQTIFPDGSGAPGLVTVKGWTYACDYLGEVRCRLVTPSSSSRPPKWAAGWVREAYEKELRAAAPPGWFDLNHAMYPKARESHNRAQIHDSKVNDIPLDMDTYVPHGRGPLSNQVLRGIRSGRRIATIGRYRVFSVDGAMVRNRVHIDFTTGGNPGRYSYVPEGEVWVEHVLEPADLAASLLHEVVEADLMIDRGLDYDAAHEEASAVETYLRAHMVWRPGPGVSLPRAVAVAREWYERWLDGQRARAAAP